MPRLPRNATHAPGALVHVICRFVDGRFVLDETARFQYPLLLARALRLLRHLNLPSAPVRPTPARAPPDEWQLGPAA